MLLTGYSLYGGKMEQRTTSIMLNIDPELLSRVDRVFPEDKETQGLPRGPKKNRSAFIRQAIRDRVEVIEKRLADEGKAA